MMMWPSKFRCTSAWNFAATPASRMSSVRSYRTRSASGTPQARRRVAIPLETSADAGLRQQSPSLHERLSPGLSSTYAVVDLLVRDGWHPAPTPRPSRRLRNLRTPGHRRSVSIDGALTIFACAPWLEEHTADRSWQHQPWAPARATPSDTAPPTAGPARRRNRATSFRHETALHPDGGGEAGIPRRPDAAPCRVTASTSARNIRSGCHPLTVCGPRRARRRPRVQRLPQPAPIPMILMFS